MWDMMVYWHNDPMCCASGNPRLLRWARVLSHSKQSGGQEEEEAGVSR